MFVCLFQGPDECLEKEVVNKNSCCSSSCDVESDNTINNVLNDDCLRHIFSNLSLRELIGIERVCKRWRSVCLGIWHTVSVLEFKKTFVTKPDVALRTDYFRELLLRCGDQLTTLDLSVVMRDLAHERVLPMISECFSLL